MRGYYPENEEEKVYLILDQLMKSFEVKVTFEDAGPKFSQTKLVIPLEVLTAYIKQMGPELKE